ncbi:MFS transporter [Aciduricibacillus chroicocephali]|uniref:MFS transporter n=1 Tax=Aciduricibacillus chroicocephali TaxID=3054939 RepID=A0ABY9L257_9BACI|nr:MFS transporter [Bacillaceae bacterium 44XB]
MNTILLLLGIIFIGANLRAPLTAVGPLIANIRTDLHLSNAIAGTITTVPLLAFALISPLAPKLAKKRGMEQAIFLSLFLLAAGMILRSLNGITLLFAGTILIGCAIAVSNVLLPSFIKTKFPRGVGIMTGIYSVAMNLFGALSSGISVPLSEWHGFGWKGALVFWVLLAVIAIIIWIPQLVKAPKPRNWKDAAFESESIWKSPLAWKVTIFMGAQSLIFYTMMTWLPELLQLRGYSNNAAGWMLSLMQFALIPVTFFIPVIADRMKNQQPLAIITAAFYFCGIGGLLFTNQVLTIICVIFIGIASGSAFSLSMMFFTLRTDNSGESAELSGMAQSFGYLLASLGPVLFGALHDLTHNWTVPIIMLLVNILVFFYAGLGAAKPGKVHNHAKAQ